MAKTVSASGLAAKLGDKGRKAVAAHGKDETKIFQDLPPGISGVARLVECKFTQIAQGKQNAGEYMFYAAGAVLSPTHAPDGSKVEGLRTQISEPLFDTPDKSRKTVDEHIAHVLNEFRKLGVDTADLGLEDLEAVAKSLKEAQPTFRFRTTQGTVQTSGPHAGKPPMTFHNWNGVIEITNEAPDDVTDNTEGEGEPSAPPAEAGEELDLEALAAAAGDDEEAQRKLTEAATALGITEDQLTEAPDWDAVVKLIQDAQGGGGKAEAPAAEETPWEPAKEEVYSYRPVDPKTKKPQKKAIEVEVTAVDKKSKTVNLKSLEDAKKTWTKVKWDDLESGE